MMNSQTQAGRPSRHKRSGSVYIAVLGTALIVGVIGICSLHVARLQVREVTALDDMADARLAARSGMECALAKIGSTSGWRSSLTSGVSNLVSGLTDTLAGSDSFVYIYIDADGNLADDPQDSVTVRSIGTSGDARHVLEVLLMPTGQGVSSLSASFHASGTIDIATASSTSQAVSSNADIRINGSGSLTGNAQAGGYISGSVTGTKSQNMTPLLEMPDPDQVFQYYLSNGTPISYAQLSSGYIQNVVLSAGANPYGTQVTNSQGIYVINCQGSLVRIRNCRIRGTLVFINATGGVELQDSILWESHVANFPALMVQGNLAMNWQSNTMLSESSLGVNFNPPHTPYQSASDSVTDDQYTGMITGLIYATGNLTTLNRSTINGVVVAGGTAVFNGQVALTYNSAYYNNAPPGFSGGSDMEIVPGTWKQVSY